MLHKALSRMNPKWLLFVDVSKISSIYPKILGSRVGFKCFSSLQYYKISDSRVWKSQHCPYHVTSRCYANDVTEKGPSNPSKNRGVVNPSLFYFTKLMVTMLNYEGLIFHVGKLFIDGITAAFYFVSDCILYKNYESLGDVVTPELLKRIKNGEICAKDADTDIFCAKKIALITLVDFNLFEDLKTEVKTIEVCVRYWYLDKDIDLVPSAKDLVSLVKTKKLKGSSINMANFKFFRSYGKNMKDSPWIIKDMFYVPVTKRLAL